MSSCANFGVLAVVWLGATWTAGATLDHMGAPLPRDLQGWEKIVIASAPYPSHPEGEEVSGDGHRCAFAVRYGGAGHTNDATLYFHSPDKGDLKAEFNPIYWDFDSSSYHWINEDLLYVRIWWGRRWGGDYIFDADTGKIVYREGFAEHHNPVQPGL